VLGTPQHGSDTRATSRALFLRFRIRDSRSTEVACLRLHNTGYPCYGRGFGDWPPWATGNMPVPRVRKCVPMQTGRGRVNESFEEKTRAKYSCPFNLAAQQGRQRW